MVPPLVPLAVLAAALLSATSRGAAQPVLRIADPRIAESSGLAVSGRHDGVLWTVNDSGDEPRIYAVGPGGRTVASYLLDVGSARDWEAVAPATDAAGRPALLVGDIGDNRARRERGILVHLVPEPERLGGGRLAVTSYRLVYPDAPRDAEGLAVNPRTGRVLVVTKGLFGGDVYAAPERLRTDRPNRLDRLGRAPALITDAAALPDGRLAVRTYDTAYVLDAGLDPVAEVALPEQPQGESLAVTRDGAALLVGSEGERSAVWRVPLPADPAPRRTPAAGRPESAAGRPGSAAGRPGSWAGRPGSWAGRPGSWGVAAAVALAALAGALVVSRRR